MRKNFLFITVLLMTVVMTFTMCKKDDTDDDTPVLTGLEGAKADYQTNYIGSNVADPHWTGTTTGCNAGVIDESAQLKVVQRVNYYRRLVGLKDNVTLNSSQNLKCQQAALYMIANQTLTHYPASSGLCYTTGAADAAGHGNIAYSKGYTGIDANHTVNAVSGYMEDPGANNLQVGHRAWILYPELSAVGSGSVWRASDNYATDCLMWGDNMNGSASGGPEFVAYPPANYIPSTLIFPRWSFSIKGANFSSASVTMKDKAGAAISCNVIHKGSTNGAPDARIAWEPAGINITADTEFTVTITGVLGAPKTSYTYTVKAFYVPALAKRKAAQNAISQYLSL